ncbi:MAG: hypothetical protein CL849_06210 [Crocinitomicaceae bacterium]|nr:hypothetical protein [Crocinitomicaceae bacterium]
MSNPTTEYCMNNLNPLIIMAAGKGSRMRSGGNLPDWVIEEAASRPKAMIRLGKERKPLLEHLVEQAKSEGLRNICIVIGEEDEVTPSHFDAHPVTDITLDFVVQRIAPGRNKPEGTAEAVELALDNYPTWKDSSVTVANGDNLPPKGMFLAMQCHPCCVPAFNSTHIGLPQERVRAFAVIRRGDDGALIGIDEKPDEQTVEASRWKDGTVRVSMNYFRMPYSDLLEAVRKAPLHPQRMERELPVAVSSWSARHPGQIQVLPSAGAFLDLTHPEDILTAGLKLDKGGFQLRD